jgi:hypothetical protein
MLKTTDTTAYVRRSMYVAMQLNLILLSMFRCVCRSARLLAFSPAPTLQMVVL